MDYTSWKGGTCGEMEEVTLAPSSWFLFTCFSKKNACESHDGQNRLRFQIKDASVLRGGVQKPQASVTWWKC
jgi:hypothetical protein